MMSKGCVAFLAHLRDDTSKVPSIESVSIVCEFLDVFPADLPGRGNGQTSDRAHCYAFPGRSEAETFDVVITCTLLVCD